MSGERHRPVRSIHFPGTYNIAFGFRQIASISAKQAAHPTGRFGLDIHLFVVFVLLMRKPDCRDVCSGDVEPVPDMVIDPNDVAALVSCLPAHQAVARRVGHVADCRSR